jgi:hypothetical protein
MIVQVLVFKAIADFKHRDNDICGAGMKRYAVQQYSKQQQNAT